MAPGPPTTQTDDFALSAIEAHATQNAKQNTWWPTQNANRKSNFASSEDPMWGPYGCINYFYFALSEDPMWGPYGRKIVFALSKVDLTTR